jgi:hypothetical protein
VLLLVVVVVVVVAVAVAVAFSWLSLLSSSLLNECHICHWKHGTSKLCARSALIKQLTVAGEQIPNATSSLEVA